jgi:hypothetical protein
MSLWLYAVLAFLTLLALFCVAWARGLPPQQNSSRAIARFEQFRGLRKVLKRAFDRQPADTAMEPLLQELDSLNAPK